MDSLENAKTNTHTHAQTDIQAHTIQNSTPSFPFVHSLCASQHNSNGKKLAALNAQMEEIGTITEGAE